MAMVKFKIDPQNSWNIRVEHQGRLIITIHGLADPRVAATLLIVAPACYSTFKGNAVPLELRLG